MFLLGIETKTHPVLPWLVWYNVAMGIVSMAAGAALWKRQRWGSALAAVILLCHGIVLLSLMALFLSGRTISRISIMAMLFRTAVWIVISMLLKGARSQPAAPRS
jgi:uncharacterized membrane protein